MKLSIKALLVAVCIAIPSQSLAYEVNPEELSFVCDGEQQCINIVSDELGDITISGNLRDMTPNAFEDSVADYCNDSGTAQCEKYLFIMKETFKQAYKDGSE